MTTTIQPQPTTAAAAAAPKRRIPYFDLIKGVAIFMVVMGHALTMCIRGIDSAFVFKLIAQVHMPLFFFVSGYFTFKATKAGGWAAPNLKKRFMQLMVPFVTMSALWTLYFPHSGLQSPLATNLHDLYQSYWKSGYWFTLCLFELMLIYWPLSRLLSRLHRVWQQVAAMLVVYGVLIALSVTLADEDANVDWAGFGLLAQFYPVFMIGAMAHRRHEGFERLRSRQWCVTASVVGFGALWYALVYPWDMPWGECTAAVTAIKFAAMPVMHFALVVVALALVEPWSARQYAPGVRPNAATRFFHLLGNESLGIYLCHYFFLFPLTALQEPMRQLGLQAVPLTVVAAAVALAVTAATLLAIAVIKRSRLLAFLLIGQSLK